MKFGLGQFTLQIPPWDSRTPAELYADTLRLAEIADEGGFDSFWLAEHHGAEDSYNPSLLPFLSAVAARTTRLQVGTAVMLAPFHHPLRLAEDAAVVDQISGGRLNLGLGLGWVEDEYRMFGVPSKGRGNRLIEIVDVLRKAWTGERFTHTGRFYSFEDVLVRPTPARPVPIWLGGNVDAAVERAVRLGDGHFPPSTVGGPKIAERARLVASLHEKAGLSGPYGYGAFLTVGLGSGADDAWRSVRDGLLHVRGAYMTWAQGRRDVSNARDAASQFEETVREGVICGTPASVVEALRPIVDGVQEAGFKDDAFLSVILAPPGTPFDRARAAVETFAEQVIPKLR